LAASVNVQGKSVLASSASPQGITFRTVVVALVFDTSSVSQTESIGALHTFSVSSNVQAFLASWVQLSAVISFALACFVQSVSERTLKTFNSVALITVRIHLETSVIAALASTES